MKKTLFSAALAATLGFVALQAQASDGTITFTGQITDAICTVTGGAGTDGAAKDITVKLDTVSVNALAANGQTAGDHPFSLIVAGGTGGNCADGTKVTLHFDGATTPSGFASAMVNPATGRLKNKTPGTGGMANNVEVGVLNTNGSQINLWTSSGSPQATVSGGKAQLDYVAQYVATGGAATVGLVNTAVMYSVIYN
jgi:major type 1 subunit fimbrin (pilin)